MMAAANGNPVDFLLEIGCEEIPARMIAGAVADLAERVAGILDVAGLAHGATRTFSTPRRLAVLVREVAQRQDDRDEEVLGPPVRAAFEPDGAPTKAALGFAHKMGVEVSALAKVPTPKGEYLSMRRRVAGRSAGEVLAEGVPKAVSGMTFPKMMRWGNGSRRFVRPVHWVVALTGSELVPFELFGVHSGVDSRGHRILGARSVPIASPSEYQASLLAQGVVVDREARRDALAEKLAEMAARENVRPVGDDLLLEEVAGLVEHPGAVLGSFPEEFLSLPREVLVTALRHHQKSFSTESDAGLARFFLVVADTDKDPEGHIRKGNEWVVVGRLEDARFFFHEDRKTPLASRREKLEHVTFHAKAGSYAEKSRRVEEIGAALARAVNEAWDAREPLEADGGDRRRVDPGVVREAARLAKCDLTTGLVGEFPELQGIAGGLYLKAEGAFVEGIGGVAHGTQRGDTIAGESGIGKDERGTKVGSVGDAIYDQYRPAGTSDALPRTLEGSILAIADRLDTLGALARCIGLPTGSRDPFGLRRAAAGAIRIASETPLPLSLEQLVGAPQTVIERTVPASKECASRQQLLDFLLERLEFWLKENGAQYDSVNAVMRGAREQRARVEWLPRLTEKVKALQSLRVAPDIEALIEIHKRCRNILEQAESIPSEAMLETPVKHDSRKEAETFETVIRNVVAAEARVKEWIEKDDFRNALFELVQIRPFLSTFFDDVLVMHPEVDVRRERLAVVNRIALMIEDVADLKQLSMSKDELKTLAKKPGTSRANAGPEGT